MSGRTFEPLCQTRLPRRYVARRVCLAAQWRRHPLREPPLIAMYHSINENGREELTRSKEVPASSSNGDSEPDIAGV